jgi:hypothetical protein
MAQVANTVARAVGGILKAETGIPFAVGLLVAQERLLPESLPVARIVERYIASDTLEKQVGAMYPSMHVYCEALENQLTERFRTFSGTAKMAIDVRVTGDHLESIENQIRHYVDAATQVLDMNRGDWGNGMFYSGGYTVTFAPIRSGGRNYLQTAKVTFNVNVSAN